MDKTVHTCYLGLGANIDNPKRQILTALKRLVMLDGITFIQSSSLYLSAPQGPQDQPDFINAVVEIQTAMDPFVLLDVLQQLEVQQKRVKTRHWGERNIDLDILLYGNLKLETIRLCIPHKQMLGREFVLVPLQEIAPDICLGQGQPISEHIKNLDIRLEKISQPPKIRANPLDPNLRTNREQD